jgi:hypothetical protein
VMIELTYNEMVRSFDHSGIAEMPSYGELRKNLDQLARELRGSGNTASLREVMDALWDMVATGPIADSCQGHCGGYSHPHRLERDDEGGLKAYYRHECGAEWTCSWGMGIYGVEFAT